MPWIPNTQISRGGTSLGWFNVKDYGAVGNGSTDDTTAIQATINAATPSMAAGGIIYFPAGKYLITSTLVIPDDAGGGVFMGSGTFNDNPYAGGNARKGGQTIIYWGGAAGDTMIEGTGISGWSFQNFALVGKTPAGTGNQAAIGFHQKYVLGGGGLAGEFSLVSFYDIGIAVQAAELSTDNSCADISFYSCVWQLCDTCLLVKNDQGVNYRFESPSVVSCPQFVNMESGGNLLVNMLNTSSCGGTGGTDWVFIFSKLEPGRGLCLINGWRCEQDTKQLLKAQYLGNVVINGLECPQSDQNVTMFQVDGVHLTLRDSRINTSDATNPCFSLGNGAGGQGGALFLDNVFFDVATWDFNEWVEFSSSQEVTLQIKNSHYGATLGELRLPDINSHLEYGPVNHFGQTTSATDRWITLDGDVITATASNVCHIPVNSTWLINAYVVGQEVGGGSDVGSFQRRATVRNNAGTLSLIGSVETIGTDQNADAWATTIQTDSSLDCLAIDVTGKASTTINWKAMIVGSRADTIS